MSDIRIDKILQWGTAAERAAFTPAPPTGIQTLYIWHETDTGSVYVYSDGTWYLISGEVIAPPPPTEQPSFLVSGGQVIWESALQFRVSAAVYYIGGIRYESAEQTVTLDAADATNPRIDLIVVDTTGTVVKITGTAAATPSEPDLDPGSQLRLTIVFVPATATEPPDVVETIVYAENAGSAAEWDWTTSGTTWDLASTSTPRTATTAIEATTVGSGAYIQGAIGTGTFDPNETEFLVLYLRPKAAWANNRTLQVTLRSAGVQVGSPVTIANGTFGFQSATLAYQQIAIPTTAFAVPAGETITQVRITRAGPGTIGFFIDDVSFIGGATTTPGGGGLTLELADARYLQISAYQRILTADPSSPPDDTYWVLRTGTAPTEVELRVRIGGVTYGAPLVTIP